MIKLISNKLKYRKKLLKVQKNLINLFYTKNNKKSYAFNIYFSLNQYNKKYLTQIN